MPMRYKHPSTEVLEHQQLRETRRSSLRSSLSPLITRHSTTFETDIVDQYLDEDLTTIEPSESTISLVEPFSPWDPISDGPRHQIFGLNSTERGSVDATALSPNLQEHYVTPASHNRGSTSPTRQLSLPYRRLHVTADSATDTTRSSRSP